MTNDDRIRDEKLPFNINRETAKNSIIFQNKHEYLTIENTPPFNRRQITEQAMFTYCPLRKDLEKKTEKEVKVPNSTSNKKGELKQIEGIFPKNMLNDLIINKLKVIFKLQYVIKTDLYYKSKWREFY